MAIATRLRARRRHNTGPKIEKWTDRRQDGGYEKPRQPLCPVSTLPPGHPVDPPPGPPKYAPAGHPPLRYEAPPPGYGPPPPGYGPPPNYTAPPGYGPPPNYTAPPGYGRSPNLGPPLRPGSVNPGIIPLRPLTLSDIFNGAVGYIRANPKATLGLTAAVVITMHVIALVTALGPLAAYGELTTEQPDELTWSVAGAWAASMFAGALVSWLGGMLLSGMLTVIVGRAVFGSPITVGEAWAKVRGRLLALIGLALLEAVGLVALIGLVVMILAAVAAAANGAAAVLIGFPLVLLVLISVAYLYTVLVFAPVLIVLERLPVVDAITRSFALVRSSFWRVFGIRLLTVLVVAIVGNAIAAPFSIASRVLLVVTEPEGSISMLLIASALSAIGAAIGQIITAPFSAGVVVLLYTDRRMRAEAFDLVLQTGAAQGPAAVESTDALWLPQPA